MDVHELVFSTVADIATFQRKTIGDIRDNTVMLECGFDSLCVASLIATLEDELGVAPFDSDEVPVPVTFGDVVRIFTDASHA